MSVHWISQPPQAATAIPATQPEQIDPPIESPPLVREQREPSPVRERPSRHAKSQPEASLPKHRSRPKSRSAKVTAKPASETSSQPVQSVPAPNNFNLDSTLVAGAAVAERVPPSIAPSETATLPSFHAEYLSNPAPAYPAASRRLGEEGTVRLRVLVDSSGAPMDILLASSSGHPRLDRAAQEAVSVWRFVPARRGERQVAGWVVVPISFALRRDS